MMRNKMMKSLIFMILLTRMSLIKLFWLILIRHMIFLLIHMNFFKKRKNSRKMTNEFKNYFKLIENI
jgi:hypothetical protein